MIEYELAGMDLSEVRFAVSPLNEVALSLRTFRDPGRYPLHLRWIEETRDARARLDRDLMLALTNTHLWTPDFITPAPRHPLARFDEELAAVAELPASVIQDDLAEIHPDPQTMPRVLSGHPDRVRERIVTVLAEYWETCFEPYWHRMRAVLEADVVFRGRQIAQAGLAEMFADLSTRVKLAEGVVSYQTTFGPDYRRSTAGEGLTLVPTLFTRSGGGAPISPDLPPVIMYAARGVGALWETERPRATDALIGLIGAVRARLLTLLESPASSTELAVRLGVTPTAVNQHLRAMRDAGLLSSARHGRSVLYLRSELGDQLIGAAS